MLETILTNPLALAGTVSGIIFLIAILSSLISFLGKSRKMRMRFVEATKAIRTAGHITVANIGLVEQEITKLPESVKRGWTEFMEKRQSYPSDYLLPRDILADKACKNSAAGKFFMLIGGLAALALCCFAAIMNLAESGGLILAGVLVVPMLIFLCGTVFVSFLSRRLTQRLRLAFSSFQDILDDRIMIVAFDKEYRFADESIRAINVKIASLLSGEYGINLEKDLLTADEKVMELTAVDVPKPATLEDILAEVEGCYYPSNVSVVGTFITDNEEQPEEIKIEVEETAEIQVEEIPVEEIKAVETIVEEVQTVETIVEETPVEEVQTAEIIVEEVQTVETIVEETKVEEVQAIETTVEENEAVAAANEENSVEKAFMRTLLAIVDAAINDENIHPSEIEEIATLLETSRIEIAGFQNEHDQMILHECLQKMADEYFSSPAYAEHAAAKEREREEKEKAAREFMGTLLSIIDNAIADANTKPSDIEEIAILIETARIETEFFQNEVDQTVLHDCLQRIADKYYGANIAAV